MSAASRSAPPEPSQPRLAAETRALLDRLAAVRYAVSIKGNRVTVTTYQGEEDYGADVGKTFAKFKQGAVKDYRASFRASADMDHVEARVLELVGKLYPETFAELDDYCARHARFVDDTLAAFDREVQFYLAYLDYIRPMKSAGLDFCYPAVSGSSKQVSADDAFDVALARKLAGDRSAVVTNSFHLDGPERVLVISGPNQGGKTTFARMFGQLHYLASLGLPVPGRGARLFLPDRMFTHFEKEEDLQNLRGKLEDELVRIHEILGGATSRSIIVMNESFVSTTLNDALFLGSDSHRQMSGKARRSHARSCVLCWTRASGSSLSLTSSIWRTDFTQKNVRRRCSCGPSGARTGSGPSGCSPGSPCRPATGRISTGRFSARLRAADHLRDNERLAMRLAITARQLPL